MYMSDSVVFLVVICTFREVVNGQYYSNYNPNYYNYYSTFNNRYGYGVTPQLVTPVVESVYFNLQCARLWDGADFRGRYLDFKQNDKQTNFRSSYFRPQSVKVKSGCSLTIFDFYGTKQVLAQDNRWIWGWSQPISAACCECDSCEGESAWRGLQCARLYENEKCNSCTGFRLDIKPGDKIRSFGPLDNLISSLVVRPGCHLVTYYERDYGGWRYNFTRPVNLLGDNWYKEISSAECFCPYNPNPTYEPPPSSPVTWYTLPTVPTSPITLPTVPVTWYSTPPSTKSTSTTTYKPTSWTSKPTETFYPTQTTAKTTTTTTETSESQEFSGEYGEPEVTTTTRTTTTEKIISSEENWDSDEEEPERTTTKPTTSRTTTTTESDSEDYSVSKEEEETTLAPVKTTTLTDYDYEAWRTTTKSAPINVVEKDDFFSSSEESSDEVIVVTTTTKPPNITKATTQRTTTTTEKEEEEDEDDGFDFGDDW